jgi:NADH-quinone oxidoreductase subunit F
MANLSSVRELKELFEKIEDSTDTHTPCIVICAGTACQASKSNDIIRVAKKYILQNQLLDDVRIRITGCHGFCEMGPFILTEPQGAFYHKVTIDNISTIIDAVVSDDYVEKLLYTDPVTGEKYYKQNDIPFFKKQQRTIFSKNQEIDPIRIYDYINAGGYRALEKVLSRLTPLQVLAEVKASGLRGRGGAGFPTGLKWEMLAGQPSRNGKYLVCNADEGDPGAYMDRSLLEGNPHSVIEGMLLGAYATGAKHGVVYVRNEYPLAIKHLIIALRQAHDLGLLGKRILGTPFSFDIQIVKGAGAFVCGEETALIRSIEGKTGEPRQRPPYPVERGIDGKPTSINNVETWANIPFIINLGAAEYAKIGTKGNSGTKIFSLVGKIKNTGLIEVPMGITIKEIVYDIGGGPAGKAKIKAVQTGGPSGGCIPASRFDLPIDYDSLAKAGSIMGSGGMIVMDEHTCMVDVAKYFMNFLKDESCGKCFTCRKGTQRMHEILVDISRGEGTLEQLELLEELALVIKDTTMCALGQTAANPVLSTLQYFRDEYLAHIVNKECPAGVCKELVGAPCQNACPLGTESWRYVAYIARGEYEDAYRVIRQANPFPSVCARVCSHPCEALCRAGTTGGQPIAIKALKRFITDRVDPAIYKPLRVNGGNGNGSKVAVVGSGPAGLSAAHYLSLQGCKVTVFEKAARPGGMLEQCIPAYRMPRDVLEREIAALMDENIELRCNTAFGSDVSADSLFKKGFDAIFLAVGAHKSRLLNLEGEEVKGVYPALDFLKDYNMQGKAKAKGRVGVIGGGDSAVDAARVALRQKGVKSVTLLYRRTQPEMPALEEEVEAALEEGVQLQTLVSPVKIHSKKGRLTGVECISNSQGEVDAGGRRKPVPIPGSEHFIPVDTLIVTIGDEPETESFSTMGIAVKKGGTVEVDNHTLETNRPGVFAGGDAVTGPNTVVEAIAAGKKAAVMIHRFLSGKGLKQTPVVHLPGVYIEPTEGEDEEPGHYQRVRVPHISMADRKHSVKEIELCLSVEEAACEARRCMRCDLEFTAPRPMEDKNKFIDSGEKSA